MTTFNSLNGFWTGVLVYGEKYAEQAGEELFFDLELKHENNIIKGKAIDTGGSGVSPDKAVVFGRFDGEKIEFTKQYTRSHYYENGKTIVVQGKAGELIYYTGNYDHTNDKFSGEWEYKIKYKRFGIFPMTYKCGGTWLMHRK